MMRALVKETPAPGLSLRRVPIPRVGPRDVLVRVDATSICGTDLHIYRFDPWARERIRPPLIQGHEVAGTVVEVGLEVRSVRVGEKISAESHVACGTCDYCRTGNAHICPRTQIIGIDRDGSFAEYLVLPEANAWKNPESMPTEVAVLLENFGNAVHAAFSVDVRAKKVLVTGCGPVGCMAVAVAKALGSRVVFATDLSKYRLKLAETMGADKTFLVGEDLVERVLEQTGGEGVDVLLEMSGSPRALHDGLTLLKSGGEAVAFGLPSRPPEVDWGNLVVLKGITIRGVVGRRLWETWYQARGLLRAKAVDLRPLVTHRFDLEDVEEGFRVMESGESGKVVFFPGGRP